MLVLSRRVGESIVISHDVVVTVLEVRGDVIRLGIDAPRDISVHRAEVSEAIRADERAREGASEPAGPAGLLDPAGDA